MFYRVDYTLAVQLAGFLLGLVFAGRFSDIPAALLARRYYLVVAVVVVLRTAAAVAGMFLGSKPWNLTSSVAGDLLGIVFGALFGLAARRKDARELLTTRPSSRL